MARRLQNLTFLFGLFIIILLISIKLILGKYFQEKEDRIRIGITIKEEKQRQALKKFFPDTKEIDKAGNIEVTARWKEFFALQKAGLDPELILEINKHALIDSQFYTLNQVDSILNFHQDNDKSIFMVEKIGESAHNNFPIKAVKISDFPEQSDDEAAILFTAAHHGNEPLGVEICLYIIDYLCANYQENQEVQQWVDNTEIWFVPMMNPDGYQLVMNDKFPVIWRKNLRDNNDDGEFIPENDGVDLNRNYDYNWSVEGDTFPSSNYYPGPCPFSEPETRTIRDLARREHFAIHLDFHSAGEVILYPTHDDHSEKNNNIIEFAGQYARKIKKRGKFSHYTIAPMNNRVGQCSPWMFNELGILSLTIEAGDSYFPSKSDRDEIIEENLKAVFWIMDKLANSH